MVLNQISKVLLAAAPSLRRRKKRRPSWLPAAAPSLTGDSGLDGVPYDEPPTVFGRELPSPYPIAFSFPGRELPSP